MQVSSVHSRHFIHYLVIICNVFTFAACADLPSRQTKISWPPERPLQIDIINFGWEDETVDVRQVSRNLHDNTLYDKAIKALAMTNNVFLSSGTVNLLTKALDDDSEEVRRRAISLLGYSRNPEAIDILSDSLQNDTSWRVQRHAAMRLGLLAGEAAVHALKAVLANRPTKNSSREYINYHGNYGFHVTNGALRGLGNAGGEGVPILIKMLNDDVKRYGGHGKAMFFIQCLESTLDRRAIQPLINIISQPSPPSDPIWEGVREHAATVLAHFAADWRYTAMLKSRSSKLARGFPVTPVKIRQVTSRDRTRIHKVLENAGYDIRRLECHSVGVTG